MRVENESVAIIGEEVFEEGAKYFIRYTLNMVDYEGIWLWDFEDHFTINVTSSVDGAVYFKKVYTFEEVENFVSHVFKDIDKIE